jgi:hypothetical protein
LLLWAACCVALLPAPVTAEDARPLDGKWVYSAMAAILRSIEPMRRRAFRRRWNSTAAGSSKSRTRKRV